MAITLVCPSCEKEIVSNSTLTDGTNILDCPTCNSVLGVVVGTSQSISRIYLALRDLDSLRADLAALTENVRTIQNEVIRHAEELRDRDPDRRLPDEYRPYRPSGFASPYDQKMFEKMTIQPPSEEDIKKFSPFIKALMKDKPDEPRT